MKERDVEYSELKETNASFKKKQYFLEYSDLSEEKERREEEKGLNYIKYPFLLFFRFFFAIYTKNMYLSSNDVINDVDVDDNSQAEQGNSPPVTSAVCKISIFSMAMNNEIYLYLSLAITIIVSILSDFTCNRRQFKF